jgi:site-specific recombinase XerC
MPRKSKYASLYTLRKDGRYQGSYTDETGRHYVYDRDPEKLYEKLQAKQRQEVHVVTFKEAADGWEMEHRAEITDRTWKNYAPHLKDIVAQFGDTPIEEMEAADVANDLARAKAKGYSATIVNTRRSIFQMIFDYAVIQGYIKYNPVSSVKLPRGLHRGKRQAPTDDQIKIICQIFNRLNNALRQEM